MSNRQPSIIGRFFTFIWDVINFSRRFIINIIFFVIVAVIISAAVTDDGEVVIAEQTALVLNLQGLIVEEKSYRDPAQEYFNEQFNGRRRAPEVLLSDAVLVIEKAAADPRIAIMVLDLKGLAGGGLNKLKTIGNALDKFKATGKKIYAFSDYYSQNQYFLASYADEINLNPMGAVLIDGYSYYGMYYKEALEKLKITQHVFKVGQYKSAVEPYTRNDMSDEAKTANQALIDELWNHYKTEVAQRRNMDINNFDESLANYLEKLKQVNGDFAQYALANQWVDGLKSREQIRQQLINEVGKDDNNSYHHVTYRNYLKTVKPRFDVPNPISDKIGVVVARGVIMDGYRKAGAIGGDSTAKLLRRARMDDNIKAVVLRVDSPGGSAFASEVIRKEIDLLQQQGKPVIASMSSVAASGGYWISSSADQIWATPTTITGSIGIYGMFMTFENSLKELGVYSDGVSTSEMAGISLTRTLDPRVGDIIQLNIERGYQRFLELVATHRNMTVEQVNEVAQGRVWTGSKALELGLIDKLGDYNEALAAAADLASLQQYDVKIIEHELSTTDKFYRDLLNSEQDVAETSANQSHIIEQLYSQLAEQLTILEQFNDPQHAYVHCSSCPVF